MNTSFGLQHCWTDLYNFSMNEQNESNRTRSRDGKVLWWAWPQGKLATTHSPFAQLLMICALMLRLFLEIRMYKCSEPEFCCPYLWDAPKWKQSTITCRMSGNNSGSLEIYVQPLSPLNNVFFFLSKLIDQEDFTCDGLLDMFPALVAMVIQTSKRPTCFVILKIQSWPKIVLWSH